MTSELIFTIDQKYYIKAIYRSLPHLVYGVDTNKLRYSSEVIQKDFNKWRNGDYVYEEFPKQKQITIHEDERVYTFSEISALTPTEIMWATFDELTRMNNNVEYLSDNNHTDENKSINESQILATNEVDKILSGIINKLYTRNLGKNLGIQLFQPSDFDRLSLEQRAQQIDMALHEYHKNLTDRLHNADKEIEKYQLNQATKNIALDDMRDLWKSACMDRDSYASERSRAIADKKNTENKLFELQEEFNKFKSETFEQSKLTTTFEIVKVDKMLSVVNFDLQDFNNYLSNNATGFIIGVRGYWVGSDRVCFNVVQLLCTKNKSFAPFTGFKLTDNNHSYPELSSHVVCHDMLGLFNNVTIRLFYDEYHILTIDENQFVSKTISQYLDRCAAKCRSELSRSLVMSDELELEILTYMTNIKIDMSIPDNFQNLNDIMKKLNGKITDGDGYWISPSMFVITKILVKLQKEEQETKDDFDHIEQNEIDNIDSADKKEVVTSDTFMSAASKLLNLRLRLDERTIKSIEKHLKKTADSPDVIIRADSGKSVSNYNIHLLLKFSA